MSRDNRVFHQAFGGTLNFPEDDEPHAAEPLLSSMGDFRSLALPEPARAPGMSMIIEAARQVVRARGREYYIQSNLDSGPFGLGAELMGLEKFLLAVSSGDKDEVAKYLDFCTQAVIDYGQAMIAAGVHGIQYGDACASLVGPEMYREYVLPYQRRTVEELADGGCDLWIHICGKTEHLLPFVATEASPSI